MERDQPSGHRFLILKLLDLTGKPVVQTGRNLDWYVQFHHSWGTHYAMFPSLAKEQCREGIVLPLIEWAAVEAGKRSDGGIDYHEVIT